MKIFNFISILFLIIASLQVSEAKFGKIASFVSKIKSKALGKLKSIKDKYSSAHSQGDDFSDTLKGFGNGFMGNGDDEQEGPESEADSDPTDENGPYQQDGGSNINAASAPLVLNIYTGSQGHGQAQGYGNNRGQKMYESQSITSPFYLNRRNPLV